MKFHPVDVDWLRMLVPKKRALSGDACQRTAITILWFITALAGSKFAYLKHNFYKFMLSFNFIAIEEVDAPETYFRRGEGPSMPTIYALFLFAFVSTCKQISSSVKSSKCRKRISHTYNELSALPCNLIAVPT